MDSPVFRLATVDDVEGLIALRIAMQQEVHKIEDALEVEKYAESLRKYFLKKVANKSFVSAVADVEGELVSANGLVVYSKPPSLTGGEGLIGYLGNVYTMPDWRKKGIAKELLKLLLGEGRIRGLDYIHLEATEDGKGIYESLGFSAPYFTALRLNIS